VGVVATERSFWTIVAQGSTPSVQYPFLTLSATGPIDLLVHALDPPSAKLARRNTAIELVRRCAGVRRCTIHSIASGYVTAACTGTRIV
jgi:hypothetical protein